MMLIHSTAPKHPCQQVGIPAINHPLHRGLTVWLGRLAVLALLSVPWRLCAAAPLVTITSQNPGVNSFIEIVNAHMDDTSALSYVQFTIAPKAGSVTRPISARYADAYLIKRGYVDATGGGFKVPVFGLYAGYTNSVTVVFGFVDGTSQTSNLSIATDQYQGKFYEQANIYGQPAVVEPRANVALSYDFAMLKTTLLGPNPTVIDTDGEIRWVGTDNSVNSEFLFHDHSFFSVGASNTTLQRMEFDGTRTIVADFAAAGVTSFNHNFDPGKTGILAEANTPDYTESVVMEIGRDGGVLHTWNMVDIITAAMVAGGDDPTKFVAAAGSQGDWFHTNCAVYRPSDDSVVISSRENFVIALDYETGAIKWILGDPTKQWFQFPSLRRYALTATLNTNYPIGQHAMSFFNDNLLLFDDGYFSLDHTPAGVNRGYSAPRKYAINQTARTATEIWNYLANPPINSPITSSVYEDTAGNFLIDYATAGPYLFAEVIGLAPGVVKAFDYKYTEVQTAQTSWNATILHLEDLVFN